MVAELQVQELAEEQVVAGLLAKLGLAPGVWHPKALLRLPFERPYDILNARMVRRHDTGTDRIEHPGQRLRLLRKRCGLSIRRLSELADVTAGMISCVERGRNSPSLATLQKILSALGTDLATFFGGEQRQCDGPIFPRERMQLVSDAERSYTIVFPKREDVQVEMLDEQILPARRRPPFETLKCDVAGYIISGSLVLELKGAARKTLRPGDAFYIPRGRKHRGYCTGDEPARLVTMYSPPRY